MNIVKYQSLKETSSDVKKGNTFIDNIINLMPKYVKEASQFIQCKRYTNILTKDALVTHAVIVVSGEISVVNEFESGKIFEPVVIYKDDFLGVVEIVLEMDKIISTNIAKTDVEYIKIPKEVFKQWLQDVNEISNIVLHSVSSNFKKNMAESGEGILLDSMYLLVSHLLKNAVKTKDLYVLSETREKTSIRTGINLRTLFRHIKKLKDDGILLNDTRHLSFNESQKRHLYDYYDQLRNK